MRVFNREVYSWDFFRSSLILNYSFYPITSTGFTSQGMCYLYCPVDFFKIELNFIIDLQYHV